MSAALAPQQPRPWHPRLMNAEDAAYYLSIGVTTLRALDIPTRGIGRRVLYDVRELDRYVDRMTGAPIPDADIAAASVEQERRFFEARRRNGRN